MAATKEAKHAKHPRARAGNDLAIVFLAQMSERTTLNVRHAELTIIGLSNELVATDLYEPTAREFI